MVIPNIQCGKFKESTAQSGVHKRNMQDMFLQFLRFGNCQLKAYAWSVRGVIRRWRHTVVQADKTTRATCCPRLAEG